MSEVTSSPWRSAPAARPVEFSAMPHTPQNLDGLKQVHCSGSLDESAQNGQHSVEFRVDFVTFRSQIRINFVAFCVKFVAFCVNFVTFCTQLVKLLQDSVCFIQIFLLYRFETHHAWDDTTVSLFFVCAGFRISYS